MTQTLTQSRPVPISEQSDLQVLRRFSLWNDPDAFAEIVRRHAAFVFATCLRVLGDSSRAQDASQETFFRLMQRPHDINQSVGAWLHRTATHLSVDARRSETARRRREIIYDSTRNREASSWSELSPAVDQALSELPIEMRAIMVQHYLLGRTQAELAAESGQSPATISRRIQEGLEQLRQRLRLKGVYALPAALAGLLCHASARQAPASLLRELGKMSMYRSATAGGGGAATAVVSHVAAFWVVVKIVFALITGLSALFLLHRASEHWLTAPPPFMRQDENHLNKPASFSMELDNVLIVSMGNKM